MRNQPPRTIGILAGGGNLPIEVAASLKARGADVKVIVFANEANESILALEPTIVHWGQVGRIVRTLKETGCRSLVIIGTVTRPELASIKPDLGLIRIIPTILRIIRAGGDDAVLRQVVAFFESCDVTVVSPADAAPELVIGEGAYGVVQAPHNATSDVATGFAVIHALAPFDVGQTVIVTNGKLEAIEGVEGTDAMLDRASSRRRETNASARHGTPTGVLVKRPKPGQELRVDLPVIGPRTAMRCIAATLSGIAVEAGKVLAVEREDLKSAADAHSLFVQGFTSEQLQAHNTSSTKPKESHKIRVLGEITPTRRARKDALKGAQLLSALDQFDQDLMSVVSRRHVLAVDHSDNRTVAIARAAKLRQWGDASSRKRIGVAILSAGRHADEQTISAVANAGLSCIAVRLTKFSATVSAPMIAAADKHKIAIVEVFPGKGH